MANLSPGLVDFPDGFFRRMQARRNCWRWRKPRCSRCSMTTLAQFRDWPAALGDDRLRPALQVGPLGVEVDAQVAIHGGPQVRRRYASIFDLATFGVRAAHHLTMG